MNRKKTIVSLMSMPALVLLTFFISSCHPEGFNWRAGEQIRFSAHSSGSASATKAAYSGNVTSGKERIDWQTGDMLRVYCAQASEPVAKYAEYVVNKGSVSGDGSVSKATIAVKPGDVALCWGTVDTDHFFYAVYPSPAIATGTIFPGSTATLMTGVIPATQTPLGLNGREKAGEPFYTAVPDLKSEYMVAYNSVKPSDIDKHFDGEVFLKFKPIVTAIEFTIKNAYAADAAHPENENLNIKNIQLLSAGHNISGTFTADLAGLSADGGTYPKCSSTSDGKTVTMDFTAIPDYDYSGNAEIAGSKKYVTVGKDSTMRFTFFLKPEYSGSTPTDVNDLTFKIIKADGSWVSTKLSYNDEAKTGINFPCHKKSYVSGLLVPEGAKWTVKYDPSVQSWNTSSPSEDVEIKDN